VTQKSYGIFSFILNVQFISKSDPKEPLLPNCQNLGKKNFNIKYLPNSTEYLSFKNMGKSGVEN
jgi:hypothetical protein